MDNFKENMKYYRMGELLAVLMLKGANYPDMQEENVGIRDGRCVLMDFADVKFFEFPAGINKDILSRLTDSIFPPVEKILKNYELVSSFRAGFISIGGVLGKLVFDNASSKGLTSFSYIQSDIKTVQLDECILDKNALDEWKTFIIDKLRYEEDGNAITHFDHKALDELLDLNRYYAFQMIVLKSYSEIDNAEDAMPFWLTALHFACEAIVQGFYYTGYGVLRKILHMCKRVYRPIVLYHAKIEELLEDKGLKDDVKKVIEANMDFNLFQLLWLLNDVDMVNKNGALEV
mgnify:FL=1